MRCGRRQSQMQGERRHKSCRTLQCPASVWPLSPWTGLLLDQTKRKPLSALQVFSPARWHALRETSAAGGETLLCADTRDCDRVRHVPLCFGLLCTWLWLRTQTSVWIALLLIIRRTQEIVAFLVEAWEDELG